MGRAWLLLQVRTGMTSEQAWPSCHPILGISPAKPWQHLGRFTSPVEAMQQAGAGKVYGELTACRFAAHGLFQSLQLGSERQLFSSFHLKGSI